jgi:EAL domain-containing protein (putative c-di-GMP-specific phosphodiesterase class I)
MGVAEPYPSPDVEQMARRAQMAMEEARGRGLSVSYFSDEMAESADERLQLETLLREALLADEGLYLLYQPQVSLKTGQVESVEALVRWDHPAMGTMLPGRFISFAEERGMGLAICDWVMQRACRQLEAWHRAGLGHIGLSINLSSDSLEIEQIAGRLKGILEETHLNPHRLELEITERFAMTETERSVAACARLKDLGVTLALDDFGTGFSSLTHLQILPVSRLKIDKSFVIGLPDDRQNLALVKGIIGLAHGLGLSVVAEGVESKAQRECLSALGCDSYQGYYFAAPMGADSIESLIRERLMPSLFTFAR